MKKPQNPPSKHHFVPKFYLKYWLDEKKLLRVYKKKRPGETHPARTKDICFEEDLYTRREMIVDVETEFFSQVDNEGDKSLLVIINEGVEKLTPEQKSSFTLFISTLYLRSPEGLEVNRQLGDYYSGGKPRENLDDIAAVLTLRTNDAEQIREREEISKAEWVLLNNKTGPKLLTSDNPLHLSALSTPSKVELLGYDLPKKYLFSLPISPTKLLFISNEEGAIRNIVNNEKNLENLYAKANIITVKNAYEKIIAQDATNDDFVLNQLRLI